MTKIKVRDIAPYGVRMPDQLKEALTIRAAKNGRSLNSEIVMILQSVVEEDKKPKGVDAIVDQELEKLRTVITEAVKSAYSKDK